MHIWEGEVIRLHGTDGSFTWLDYKFVITIHNCDSSKCVHGLQHQIKTKAGCYCWHHLLFVSGHINGDGGLLNPVQGAASANNPFTPRTLLGHALVGDSTASQPTVRALVVNFLHLPLLVSSIVLQAHATIPHLDIKWHAS